MLLLLVLFICTACCCCCCAAVCCCTACVRCCCCCCRAARAGPQGLIHHGRKVRQVVHRHPVEGFDGRWQELVAVVELVRQHL
jgi:hypothetical protein